MAEFKVALLQNDSVRLDSQAQLAALQAAADEASHHAAQLLITPEMFMSGYYIPGRVVDMAEPQDGLFLAAASDIARQAGIALLVGYPEKSRQGVYNSAALIGSDGNLVLNHRKMHLSGAYEKEHFITDTNIPRVAEVSGVRVAPLICYDVEFPEAVRACALAGADLVAVPTALVEEYAFLTRTMIPTRAFENGVFVAYVNHAGTEGPLQFAGFSTFADPMGNWHQAGPDTAETIYAVVSLDTTGQARRRLPYLEVRRRDLI